MTAQVLDTRTESDGYSRLLDLDVRACWKEFQAQPAAFKLACLYVFFEYVRPQSIYPVLDGVPWVQITILMAAAATAVYNARAGWVRASITSWLVVFTLVVLASGVMAQFPREAWDYKDQFGPWVLIYFMLIGAVRTRVQFVLFLMLYLLWSFKMSQHGFLSWASIGFGFRSWGVTGAPGWFRNSGEVGIQMCYFMPLALLFWMSLRKRWPLWKNLAVLVVPVTAIGTIIATTSRGAMVGGALALLWLATSGRNRAKMLFLVCAIALAAYWVIPDAFVERFQTMGDDDTSIARIEYWKNGLDMVSRYPWLGIGYFNWIPYYQAHYPVVHYSGVQLPHNIFIQAASELGVTGFLVLLGLIAASFRTNFVSRRLARASGDEFLVAMSTALDAGMIGFLVSAQFITVLYYPYLWIALPFSVMLNSAAKGTGVVPQAVRWRQAGQRA